LDPTLRNMHRLHSHCAPPEKIPQLHFRGYFVKTKQKISSYSAPYNSTSPREARNSNLVRFVGCI
jgi:hypothetical protein